MCSNGILKSFRLQHNSAMVIAMLKLHDAGDISAHNLVPRVSPFHVPGSKKGT